MTLLVSALCPTYGRCPDWQHLLEEAIQSFLGQSTTTTRELVVLNDSSVQELVCTAPGVRVINHHVRCGSLGAKYNALVSLAQGDILMPWEDDDLSLPGRIDQAVLALRDHDYFNPGRTWFMDGTGLHYDHAHGYCHNASACTRRAWTLVGGYPEVSGHQDVMMDRMLRASVGVALPLGPDPSSWTYIYRWGVSNIHLSAYSDSGAKWREVGAAPVARGRYLLRPHWRRDYRADVQASLEHYRRMGGH